MINGLVQIAFDLGILYTLGWRPLAYLLLGTVLGLGCHPLSGHFISEHYLFQTADHQATHSYYGPLNFIMFNLGYHVEHHGTPLVYCTVRYSQLTSHFTCSAHVHILYMYTTTQCFVLYT